MIFISCHDFHNNVLKLMFCHDFHNNVMIIIFCYDFHNNVLKLMFCYNFTIFLYDDDHDFYDRHIMINSK